jgi:hypothetical protein
MAKSAMPVSKAKTAYGLLSEIRKLILEEPRRYDQSDFLSIGEVAERRYDYVPACGTVGCVAGWVCALKGSSDLREWDVIAKADEILGIEDGIGVDSMVLFGANKAGARFETPRAVERHAERGAAHIARFQKKYAKKLKAKRV